MKIVEISSGCGMTEGAMKLQYEISGDLLFAAKPTSVSTHAPDIGKRGFAEVLEAELGQKLYVVHRLDKTTSGAICFALTPEKAASVAEAFKNHQVTKKYLFLTDRHVEQDDFDHLEVSSNIEKIGKDYISQKMPAGTANAHTKFTRLKRSPFFSLWQAEPQSGKPHQIRLHAKDAGIPILGDSLYGGTAFARICLHSLELTVPGYKKFTSFAPWFFDRLGLLRDVELIQILSAIDDREKAYHFLQAPETCLRLIHSEVKDIRCDAYGEVLWVYWYRDLAPNEKDLERWHLVARALNKKLMIRKMQNRGEDPLTQMSWEIPEIPKTWMAEENGLKYLFKKDQGLSPGLFLDQRNNRKKIQELSPGKRLLNLFSYTCGFSLSAAAAKAAEVTTVDLSGTFLDWGKQTFILNSVDPQRYEFFKQDCLLFLRGAIKRQRQFDLIICDPPSFARFNSGKKKEIFKLDKDAAELIGLCFEVLADQGQLLFSCNFEKWSEQDFLNEIKNALRGKKVHISLAEPSLDFEKLNDEPLMKAAWIKKF